MAQKMNLKKMQQLNQRGTELNNMNQYGEKLLAKKYTQDSLSKKINDMENKEQ